MITKIIFPIYYLHKQSPSLLLALLMLGFVFTAACSAEDKLVVLRGETMGTYWQVQIVDKSKTIKQQEFIQQEINKILQNVNNTFSTWQKDSEISVFNRQKTLDWIPVSDDLAKLVHITQDISSKTDGLYDITIYPLMKLWGFTSADRQNVKNIPQNILIETKKKIGWQKLQVQISPPAPPALRKTQTELQIDLSSIAKGYAVDLIANKLKKLNIHNFLVEIGGEIFVSGHNLNKQNWHVGLESPSNPQKQVSQVLKITNKAVATSGDYRNYVNVTGQKMTHIIDPHTAKPKLVTANSVTVIADDCALADAWATALFLLGPKKGVDVADKYKIAAFYVFNNENNKNTYIASQSFLQFLPENNL